MRQFFKPDLEKIKKAKTEKEKNCIERLEFVKFWAEYIRTHSDEDWSKQQNVLINSQIKSSQSLFRDRFGEGEEFKKNAREYFRNVGVLS